MDKQSCNIKGGVDVQGMPNLYPQHCGHQLRLVIDIQVLASSVRRMRDFAIHMWNRGVADLILQATGVSQVGSCGEAPAALQQQMLLHMDASQGTSNRSGCSFGR